jgi:hypothetical protein
VDWERTLPFDYARTLMYDHWLSLRRAEIRAGRLDKDCGA